MKLKSKMTFIDFFAGIGGFTAGLEQAGMKCVGFCEKDKWAIKSYQNMHLNGADISKSNRYLAVADKKELWGIA